LLAAPAGADDNPSGASVLRSGSLVVKRFAVPFAFVVVLSALASLQAQPGKDDAKKIQGIWVATEFEKDAIKRPPQGQFKLKISAEAIEAVGMDDPTMYKLGAEKGLGTIDITPSRGPDKGKVIKGLYELKGDNLRICLPASPDSDRPREFTSRDGGGIIYLKRETP
jgi:uncharacterized protein (TIGR03067 family)